MPARKPLKEFTRFPWCGNVYAPCDTIEIIYQLLGF